MAKTKIGVLYAI